MIELALKEESDREHRREEEKKEFMGPIKSTAVVENIKKKHELEKRASQYEDQMENYMELKRLQAEKKHRKRDKEMNMSAAKDRSLLAIKAAKRRKSKLNLSKALHDKI